MSADATTPPGTSWSGTYRYAARAVHHPASEAELQQRVSSLEHVRALGTRHSFTSIADTEGELVSTLALQETFDVDPTGSRVRVGAGTTYARLAELLLPHGLALANLPSLPHVCVGGAVATGTHGSGRRLGSLATHVAGLRMVLASGDVVEVTRDDADFAGQVVSLGALGVVTALDLDVEPAYEVAQWALSGDSVLDVVDALDEVMALGDSVSVFTRWDGPVLVLVKRRLPADPPEHALLRPVPEPVHVLRDADPAAMTAQLGAPGRWDERLPHFRADAVPSRGAEIQSEYFVRAGPAREALAALAGLAEVLHPVLLVSEVRSVAGDDLWLSGAEGGDQVGIHLTWRPDRAAVDVAVEQVEAALEPYRPRPHWGKRFLLPSAALAEAFPRLPDFVALAHDRDPTGKLSNPFLRATIGL